MAWCVEVIKISRKESAMTEYEHMSSDDILRRIELTLENPRQYPDNHLELHSLYTEKLTMEEMLSDFDSIAARNEAHDRFMANYREQS